MAPLVAFNKMRNSVEWGRRRHRIAEQTNARRMNATGWHQPETWARQGDGSHGRDGVEHGAK